MAVAGSLVLASSAGAATLSVDDDGRDCPAAPYTSIQSAVDAAAPGDTVTVCAGDYVEGPGTVGSNALLINKDLTLKGAGADLVHISPKASSTAGGRIMETTPDLRNGLGDIVAVVGAPTRPISVNISGVTVDGFDPADTPVAVEAGVVYLDAKGSISRSRVTNLVTSEADTAYQQDGGYRGTQPGVGIVQTSATRNAQSDGTRTLKIELTRVDKYNKYGVLIDGATNDTPPLTPSGVINRGEITASQIVGRTQCINYLGTGSCGSRGIVDNLVTGPLFGQDGVRVTSGARAQIADTLISQNLVNGTGAPVRGSTTNNANLLLGSGIRLVGAFLTTPPVSSGLNRSYNTSVTRSNIVDNAYGALNLQADGVTANSGTKNNGSGTSNVFLAENNWWGLRITAPAGTPGGNAGPVISPTTTPAWPENPVNGVSAADSDVPTAFTSTAVDMYPFRDGVASDPDNGQFTLANAPLPVDDAAPTDVTVSASTTSVAPGGSVTLTATGDDDFGVKRVRFYDGATLVGDTTVTSATTTVAIPADAACGSTHAFTALVGDSLGQTTSSAPVVVTVACPAPPTTPGTGTTPPPVVTPPAPAAPTIAFGTKPTTITASGSTVKLDASVAAGIKSVEIRLGSRVVCTETKAPYSCKVVPTGADVGVQALTATITDLNGSTSVVTSKVTVAKFTPRIRTKVTKKKVSSRRTKRTFKATVVLPKGVTKAQGCKGTVTLVVRRNGQSVLNQQVKLSKSCTVTRSVTAARSGQKFTVSARYGGSSVLTAKSISRRFS
ncbi:Ig-like domain-containing protein [Patulibacter sp. NPDC049589]|uniref:Ig-like domain-containing protein n=1 Tax=Patulibacter sp. NPDC049589 TaxID=3154731 RepID=UPI00343B5E58